MSDLQAWRMLLTAGEIALAATLALAVTALAARAARGASLRHLVRLGGFAVLLLLPLLAALMPARVILAAPVPAAMPVAGVPAAVPQIAAAPSWHLDITVAAAGLALLWLPGLTWLALRGVAAAWALYRLRRAVQPWHCDLAIDGLQQADLRVGPDGRGPMTWGFFRPVILLPVQAKVWPPARLEAVLRHELAHVRRRDWLTQVFVRGVCALYWPHPMVWAAAKALRRDAECAADDAVLTAGHRASFYAGLLLALAAESRAAAAGALPMAAGAALETRLAAILDETQTRTGVRKMDIVKIACLGVSATALLVLARPSFAEPVQPPAPMAAPALAVAAPALAGPVMAEPVMAVPAPVARPVPLPVEHALVVAEVVPPAEHKSEAKQESSSESTSESERTVTEDGIDRTVRERVRRTMKRVGDTAEIRAQVTMQVDAAMAEADVARKVALAASDAQMEAAVAEAKAKVAADLARQKAAEPRPGAAQ